MQHKDETKEIYGAILNIASETSNILSAIANQIKASLDMALQTHYKTNKALASLASKNAMNPILAQNASPDIKPQIEALQSLHRDISSQNQQIQQMQASLSMLGQGNIDPALAQQIKNGQERVLNQSYATNELALQAQKEFNQLITLTGDAKNTNSELLTKSKDNLSNLISQINQNNHEIKATLREQSNLVNKAGAEAAPETPKQESPSKSRPG